MRSKINFKNILSVVSKWFLPIILLISIILISKIFSHYYDSVVANYVSYTTLYLFTTYYIIHYFITIRGFYRKLLKWSVKSTNTHGWLDSLDGYENLLDEIYKDMKFHGNAIKDLTESKKRLKEYCKNDVKKVKLLKAYIETVYADQSGTYFMKIIISLIPAAIITVITKNDSIMQFMFYLNNEFLSDGYYSAMNIIFFVIWLVIIIIYTITLFNYGKNRLKITNELLILSIEELENEKTKKRK